MSHAEAIDLAEVVRAEIGYPVSVQVAGGTFLVEILCPDGSVYSLWDELDWPWIRQKMRSHS
jgi:hypothetical protein